MQLYSFSVEIHAVKEKLRTKPNYGIWPEVHKKKLY